MKQQIKYSFNYIERCSMCEDKSDTHKILGKRLNGSQGKNPRKKIGITTSVCLCSNCGLIYTNPQPIPINIEDHYGVTPENYWKESYFEKNGKYFQPQIIKLKTLFDIKPGMKSLDVGSGLGKAMIALSEAGFDSYGFEPSKQFYERAISQMGISPQKMQLGSIEQIEYPNNTFDFISFGAVLEHLYDPSYSVLKALDWLKPNGIIHIEVPSSNWLINKLVNLFYKVKGSDYVANLSPMHNPYHLYEFSLKSFQLHSQKHGYELALHEYYVCETFMPKIADFILKPYMKMTNSGMQLCVWLKKK